MSPSSFDSVIVIVCTVLHVFGAYQLALRDAQVMDVWCWHTRQVGRGLGLGDSITGSTGICAVNVYGQ